MRTDRWMTEDRLLLYDRYAAEMAHRISSRLPQGWGLDVIRASDPVEHQKRMFDRAKALVTTRYGSELPPSPRLRLIQIPAAGINGIDFAAVPLGCQVCNVFEHEGPIAEYVLLAMLEWQIGMTRLDANLRDGQWSGGGSSEGITHQELAGRSLGIIGAGHIARAVAQRAQAFGVHCRSITRNPESVADLGWPVQGMDKMMELLATSDFVLIAVPLSETTRGLIGEAELSQMKPSAVLINVARGKIVQEAPLYAALAERRIRGATLDVWYRYPKPGETEGSPSQFPFQNLDNVQMTPHASAWTDALFVRRWDKVADNLHRLANHQPLLNLISSNHE